MTTSGRNFTTISVITAVSMAITAFVSVFVRNPYLKESLSYASQGKGQDVFDLAIVSPVLIIASILMKKGNKFWENVWAGAMVYILYSYVIYGFAVHFNYLFLAYCAILSASFFALVFYFFEMDKTAIYVPKKLSGISIAASVFLSIVALIFAFLWLTDIIPALIADTLPKAVAENNFFTNPVHVLDIAFALPACVIAVIMLLTKKRIGRILAATMLSLCMFMLPALSAMVFGMKKAGVTQDISIAFLFLTFGIAAAVILSFFSREQEPKLP